MRRVTEFDVSEEDLLGNLIGTVAPLVRRRDRSLNEVKALLETEAVEPLTGDEAAQLFRLAGFSPPAQRRWHPLVEVAAKITSVVAAASIMVGLTALSHTMRVGNTQSTKHLVIASREAPHIPNAHGRNTPTWPNDILSSCEPTGQQERRRSDVALGRKHDADKIGDRAAVGQALRSDHKNEIEALRSDHKKEIEALKKRIESLESAPQKVTVVRLDLSPVVAYVAALLKQKKGAETPNIIVANSPRSSLYVGPSGTLGTAMGGRFSFDSSTTSGAMVSPMFKGTSIDLSTMRIGGEAKLDLLQGTSADVFADSTEVIEGAPSFVERFRKNVYAKALDDVEEAAKALDDAVEAIRRNSEDAGAYTRRGAACKQAVEAAMRTAELSGGKAINGLNNLVTSYAESGNLDAAVYCGEESLQMLPEKDPDRQKFVDLIKRCRDKKLSRDLKQGNSGDK